MEILIKNLKNSSLYFWYSFNTEECEEPSLETQSFLKVLCISKDEFNTLYCGEM